MGRTKQSNRVYLLGDPTVQSEAYSLHRARIVKKEGDVVTVKVKHHRKLYKAPKYRILDKNFLKKPERIERGDLLFAAWRDDKNAKGYWPAKIKKSVGKYWVKVEWVGWNQKSLVRKSNLRVKMDK